MKKLSAAEVREAILDSATQLFIEKGYDATTVQDIMDPLEGLTKGAFYHHFKSKEEVSEKVITRLIPEPEIIEEIIMDASRSGLRKIQDIFLRSIFDASIVKHVLNSSELLRSPIFFLKYIERINAALIPSLTQAIEEGNQDETLKAIHPQQTAELLTLVLSTWFINAIYPNTIETFEEKFEVSQQFFKNNNLDVLDDYVIESMKTEMSKQHEALGEV